MKTRTIPVVLIFVMGILLLGCNSDAVRNEQYLQIDNNYCIDKNNDRLCNGKEDVPLVDDNSSSEKIEELNRVENQTYYSPAVDYNFLEVQHNINDAFEKNFTWREDISNRRYFNTGPDKIYVIKELNTEIKDVMDFYDLFSARRWGDNFYFINQTELGWLNPSLNKEDFSNERDYEEYIKNRYTIEQTTIEKIFVLEEGKVLEYQFINWKYDKYGYFAGAWQDTLLVYKIYCSPRQVIYLRPEWENLQIWVIGAKSQEIYGNWNSAVDRMRKDLLPKANMILKDCPVEKEFFELLPTKEFKKTIQLYYHYPADIEFFWKMNTSISVGINNESGEISLASINVTFSNNEEFDVGGGEGIFFDVRTSADGKEMEDFVTSRKMTTTFPAGMSIHRELFKQERVVFRNNLTIEVKPYLDEGKVPFRPSTHLLFSEGSIVRIK